MSVPDISNNNFWVGMLIIVFNAGGFVWLARNHFHEVKERLDALNARIDQTNERVYDIHGKVSAMTTQLDSVVEFLVKESKIK